MANQVVSNHYRWCDENTCDNLLNPPQNCTIDCFDKDICVCKKGLYRNQCNKCVTAAECRTNCSLYEPIVCTGDNEELDPCFDPTTAKVCPHVRCSNPRDLFLRAAKRKQPGLCALTICDCKDGFLRNKCGKCVPEAECSRKCTIRESDPCRGPNEVRITKYYKRRYSRSCSNKKERRRIKKSVCVCAEGTVRDPCGQCIPETWLNVKAPSCLVTNPCQNVPINDLEWQCLVKNVIWDKYYLE